MHDNQFNPSILKRKHVEMSPYDAFYTFSAPWGFCLSILRKCLVSKNDNP